MADYGKKKTAAKKDKLKPLKKGIIGRTQKKRMGRAARIAKGIRGR